MLRLVDGGLVGGGVTAYTGPDGGPAQDMAVLRLRSDGLLDPSFGNVSAGVSLVSTTGTPWCAAVAVQSNGALVLGGVVTHPTGDYAVARLLPNGQLDPTFNGTGVSMLVSASNDTDNAVLVLQSGAVLLGGMSDSKSSLARFNSNGSVDTTFGTAGLLVDDLSPGFESHWHALLLQPDGKIVAIGYMGMVRSPAIVRYDTNGARDPTFGDGGIAVIPVAAVSEPEAGLIDSAGRVVFVGFAPGVYIVGRLLPNGTLDKSFGADAGYVLPPFAGSNNEGFAITEQADGKLVVGGQANNHVGLLRLWP
jgi:uncharacterized delta-60 repeat protein